MTNQTYRRFLLGMAAVLLTAGQAVLLAADWNTETETVRIQATGSEIRNLMNDMPAFGNRDYTWQDVPDEWDGCFYTQTCGGEKASLVVTAKTDTTISAVLGDAELAADEGWTLVNPKLFRYTDHKKTVMALYQKSLAAGEVCEIPQVSWTGTILLFDTPIGWDRPIPGHLVRMEYNNPGLTDFLAVGLWSWPVPCDADGDGDFDLIISCEDTPYNGTYLFENPGPADNPFPVFKKARRISHGEINVQASWTDGHLRVLTPNKEYPDFCKTGLEKPVDLGQNPNPHVNNVRGNMWKYVDFNGDGLLDLAVGSDDWTDYGWDNAWDENGVWQSGPLRGIVYIKINRGTNEKPEYDEPFALKTTAGERLESYGWPSPCFVDFDLDGDLDLMCGDFRDRFVYFENVGTSTEPAYAPAEAVLDNEGNRLTIELEMATPVVFDWNRDGKPDILCGDEDGRIACFLNTGHFEETANGRKVPVFAQRVYFRQEADFIKGGSLVSPTVADFDLDGDQDIIAGNAAGFFLFFENLSGLGVEYPVFNEPKRLECAAADGSRKVFRIFAGPNGSIQGPCEEKWGYLTQSVADWNRDGLPDIIFNSIWGRILWLENLGPAENPVFAPARPVEADWNGQQPHLAWGWLMPENIGKAMVNHIAPDADSSNESPNGILTQWRTTPAVYDYNQDGLPDLAVLDTEGYLVFYQRYQKEDGSLGLMRPRKAFLDGDGNPLRLTEGKAGGSGRRKIAVGDYDGDGRFDLVLNSYNADFYQQIKFSDGENPTWMFKNRGNLGDKRLQGHSAHPTFCDFNADGIADLVIGAEDGHCYYLRHPANNHEKK